MNGHPLNSTLTSNPSLTLQRTPVWYFRLIQLTRMVMQDLAWVARNLQEIRPLISDVRFWFIYLSLLFQRTDMNFDIGKLMIASKLWQWLSISQPHQLGLSLPLCSCLTTAMPYLRTQQWELNLQCLCKWRSQCGVGFVMLVFVSRVAKSGTWELMRPTYI